MLDVQYSPEDVLRVTTKLKSLSDSKQNSVIASTINKIARDFRKKEKQDIKNRFTAKKNPTPRIVRASPSRLEAQVIFPYKQRPSGSFQVRKGTKKSGAKVRIIRGGKYEERSYNGNKGFKLSLANGSVFVRQYSSDIMKGKKKGNGQGTFEHGHPIELEVGPSYRGMAHSPEFYPQNVTETQSHLLEELDKHIATAMKGKK